MTSVRAVPLLLAGLVRATSEPLILAMAVLSGIPGPVTIIPAASPVVGAKFDNVLFVIVVFAYTGTLALPVVVSKRLIVPLEMVLFDAPVFELTRMAPAISSPVRERALPPRSTSRVRTSC